MTKEPKVMKLYPNKESRNIEERSDFEGRFAGRCRPSFEFALYLRLISEAERKELKLVDRRRRTVGKIGILDGPRS